MDAYERAKAIIIWTDSAGKERVTYDDAPMTDDMPTEVRVWLRRQSYSAAYREACCSPRPVLHQDAPQQIASGPKPNGRNKA